MMGKSLSALFKKDCRMMAAGKFFVVALGSLLLYTLFINFGYVKFMDANANSRSFWPGFAACRQGRLSGGIKRGLG